VVGQVLRLAPNYKEKSFFVFVNVEIIFVLKNGMHAMAAGVNACVRIASTPAVNPRPGWFCHPFLKSTDKFNG
jgi:hypothetical protein